ncbi:MAG: LPS export ABC transporter permease LptF [Deltaproteobacteria bacterium RIFCSPLOWO2_12_FULL_60_19]|nr:MAG: LPS export ABC transporter permease LptF [Deltaproteobacteria bacterium RIFCSPLOWO2_12_FULL_60_19]
MKRTLGFYIAREILPPFLFGLMAFTIILLIARLLKLVDMVVTRGVSFAQIGKLFALILPTFLESTVPMALLLGIFLGLGRLASDHEILALKASGVSPVQIVWPVAVIALVVSVVALIITTQVRPAANTAMRKALYNIAKTRVTSELKEKVFNDDFPKVLIYIEELVPPGETAKGVLIVDRRRVDREQDIFSKVAFIFSDEESQTINFRLFEGTVYEKEAKRPGFSRTRFNTYDFKLDPTEVLGPARPQDPSPKEMSLRRLRKTIQLKQEQGERFTVELMELHLRFSFAFAPLALALLAVSLVLVPTRSRASRSWGFALCLTWLLVYYGLLSAGKALGSRELLPAALAAWLPNIVLALIAAHFFRKALKESPFLIQSKLEDLSFHLRRRFAGLRQPRAL